MESGNTCMHMFRMFRQLQLYIQHDIGKIEHWPNFEHTKDTSYVSLTVELWASYQIRKIAGCACAGNAGNIFPRRRFQRKPLVSDPGMHHGTCVTHVPWCMSGSLTCGDGENVPGIPGACAPAILRIWQEAHGVSFVSFIYLFIFEKQNCKISREQCTTRRWLNAEVLVHC